MAYNITTGSTVSFSVEFFNAAGVLTVPISATMTISYPPSSNNVITATTTISLTPAGNFFTGTWGTGVAALGLSSFSVSAPGQTTPTTGTLRITG